MEKMVGVLLRVAAPVLPRSARASSSALVAAALLEAAIQQSAGMQIVTSERFAGPG